MVMVGLETVSFYDLEYVNVFTCFYMFLAHKTHSKYYASEIITSHPV